MERKQDIRKVLLQYRNSLTEEKRQEYSNMIAGRLLSLPLYEKAEVLLIYASYGSEVSTYTIMEEAFRHNKMVYCPKVLQAGLMEFYKIHSIKELTRGYKGILEPEETEVFWREYKKAVMIMPLVGFDQKRNRLGYGGGYYDRYLEKHPDIRTVALGFECQKTEFLLPAEPVDRKPDYVITEKHMFE